MLGSRLCVNVPRIVLPASLNFAGAVHTIGAMALKFSRQTAHMRVVFQTRCAVLTFHVQSGINGRYDAGAIPSVGFELPRTLVLKNTRHVVHDEHGLRHLHAHLTLPVREPRRVVADQFHSERAHQLEAIAEHQAAGEGRERRDFHA